jgi:hypothetical protein
MGNELAEQVAAADPEAAARTRALRIWLPREWPLVGPAPDQRADLSM